MIRKIVAAAALLAVFGHAFAAVDVNTANEDAMRGIKGIGPARAKAILDERSAHGPYKDAADLGKRVKGLGGHTVERLQAEGLSVGPANAQPARAVAAQAAPAKAGAQQPATVAVKK
ncbi:MAG TPA: helix-hairpin-helix domain-containing protein [Paraburkholderia sp.]|uniref:ComEA family DNA-binding protein n=1 Tax=Paraburkholderia sp. TaxID=1926495 RepID=UPI002C13B207|nr:helix-hairpin-helix domain-containing protein [Paraburkholderia sp.]HTR07054.1 helix-hairpin-helix domain-containing protein [Paraburkholderia sp.]